MAQFLAPILNDQQEDANGKPLSGGLIEVYLAGTSTPATTTSDKAGTVPNSWPIVLNTLGVNSQGAVWLTGGSAYKYVIKSSTGVSQRTIDNISGINDTSITTDQWIVYQGVPTYVSATSFTVPGDQTQIFQINRRLKSTNTGGTIYSTITNSVYAAPNTTVTVRNDSGTLDAGLSQVAYGLISAQDSSVSGLLLGTRALPDGVYTPTAGTTWVVFDVQAPGGGGGGAAATTGSTAACAAGGGSGSRAIGRFTAGFAGVTITNGTAGGAGGIGANGGNGGTASVGALMSCPGGLGGQAGAPVTPPTFASSIAAGGGSPTGGNILSTQGNQGGCGVALALGQVLSGKGADSAYGSGGLARLNTSAAGVDGTGYGSGGGGAASGASGGGFLGGNGRPGIIIVYEYA